MRKKSSIYSLIVIWLVFMFLFTIVIIVGRNIIYTVQGKNLKILDPDAFVVKDMDNKETRPDTLILYQNNLDSKKGFWEMRAILKQMRLPCSKCKTADFKPEILKDYHRVIISVSDASVIEPFIPQIREYVEEGGYIMFAIPPHVSQSPETMDLMGIQTLSENELATVKGFTAVGDFMPGGSRKLSISTPYESSLDARVSEDCRIYMTSTDKRAVPLIWKRKAGKGGVIVDNFGFIEKAYRGYHCAAYTLMDECTVWPVINGSAFYIDDFPSPVPPGDSYQILQDYGMDIKDFYTQVWWKDVSNLARKYNIRYTGLIIEMYNAQTSGELPRQTDTTRFEYFGNMLLDMGGELGIHGYNHMPLVLEDFDYLGKYYSYFQWISVDEIRDSISEVLDFSHSVFPHQTFTVYVPPSNIISKEGRKVLAEDFPEIKCIASLYLPDQNDVSYATNFEITEDGLIQTPRITSGYVLDDYMNAAACSELYLHCVNTHFQHPDDVLDVDRGANLGWQELYSRLENYVSWLHNALPSLRALTGSEMAAAVQRYSNIRMKKKVGKNKIKLSLDGFADEAWFYLKINGKRPDSIKGGKMTRVAEGLYLIEATSPKITIITQ